MNFHIPPQTILLYKYFIFLILFNISIQRLLSTQEVEFSSMDTKVKKYSNKLKLFGGALKLPNLFLFYISFYKSLIDVI